MYPHLYPPTHTQWVHCGSDARLDQAVASYSAARGRAARARLAHSKLFHGITRWLPPRRNSGGNSFRKHQKPSGQNRMSSGSAIL